VATRSTKSATPQSEEAPAIDYSSMNLTQRLAKARELLGGGVAKGGRNVDQKYDYVKASDVSRAVYDALAAVGLYATPSYTILGDPVHWVNARGTNQFMAMLKVTLRIGAIEKPFGTGDVMVVETIGYGADTGDKGPYKAMTGALKYALLHSVGLATDDDPEATREEPTPAAVERKVGPQSSAPAPTTPVGDDPKAPITTSQSRLIFGKANDAGLTPDQFRSLVFFVTGKRKSTQLVSKEVDDILTALQDEAQIIRAKQEDSFDATVGQAPDPTKDAQAEADRIAAEAAERTGGTVITP
jgi:hypothetical protein